MASVDPYGRAIRDHYKGNQDGRLLDRDGNVTRDHPIAEFYFDEITDESDRQQWRDGWLDGPLLDMGAGAGSQALYWQDQFETVAIEVSDHLVETMRDRGVENAVKADMFALREHFEENRFQSAHARGTQVQLAGSMDGLRRFLGDLNAVTKPDATALLDFHDPMSDGVKEILGYRSDPTLGLAYRVLYFEYDGDVSETLLFRLFSPDRLREAIIGTGWKVAEINWSENNFHYIAVLTTV
jgi:hypothetical protein